MVLALSLVGGSVFLGSGCETPYDPGQVEDVPSEPIASAPVRRFYAWEHRVRELRNLADHHASERRDQARISAWWSQAVTSLGTLIAAILAVLAAGTRKRAIQAASSTRRVDETASAAPEADEAGGAVPRADGAGPEVPGPWRTYGAIAAALIAFLSSMFQAWNTYTGAAEPLVTYAATLGTALQDVETQSAALIANPNDIAAANTGVRTLRHAVADVRDDIIREVGLEPVRHCEQVAQERARSALGGNGIAEAFAAPTAASQ